MRYTTKETVTNVKITEEYHVDGVTYQAELTTYGKGGIYEELYLGSFKTRIELAGLGKVSVTFPSGNMLNVKRGVRPARFTPYAKEKLAEVVLMFVAIHRMVRERGFTVSQLDLSIQV